MSPGRIIEWIFLLATGALMVVLNKLHIGVTHYNIFLLVLLGWGLGLILVFRILARKPDA